MKTSNSPYLQHKLADMISQTGLSIMELADKAGLSYGYMCRIVNGSVIPNRAALRRICEGLGLDFAVEWRAIHSDQVSRGPAIEDTAIKAVKFFSVAREKLTQPSDEVDGLLQQRGLTRQSLGAVEEDVADLVREKVTELMNTLPLAGVAELFYQAKELSQKYNQGD